MSKLRRRATAPRPSARLRNRLKAYRSSRPPREERPIPPRVAVPSFFTLLNLFCGFLAVIQISEGRTEYAAWLIVMAGFFDLLDGMMARLAGATSDFGLQLDSLADIVSFGVAPSFLVYSNGLDQFNALGMMVAALPAICGAVRLARFNVMASEADAGKKDFFSGLPIPAQAATLVSFILTFDDPTWFSRFAQGRLSVLIPIVIVLSTLMVTSIRFDAIPTPSRGYVRTHKLQVISFCIAVLLVLFFQESGLLAALLLYILHALARAAWATGLAIWSDDQ